MTGIDWIALSFVQRADDVAEAKKMIRGRAAVMAKIEKPQAIDRLAEIIEVADALMVARGDLGVELPLERVPSLQKQMTRLARRAGKPVVVATQMLESMIQSPVPTRAEVSDVATAVYEGADAIMLSAESAAGKYPVEAVSTMNRIGEEVERDPIYRGVLTAQRAEPEPTAGDAIADAARQIAETLDLLRDHLLDQFRVDRAARGARTAEAAGRRDHAEPRDRPQAGAWCGACTAWSRKTPTTRTTWSIAPANRVPRWICQGRPAHHHRGRRAARHARRHQHGPHRLCRPERRNGYLGMLDLSTKARIRQRMSAARATSSTAVICSISLTTRSGAAFCTMWPTPGSTISFAPGTAAANGREWMFSDTVLSASPCITTVGTLMVA